jgi:cytochrome c5
MKLKVLGTFAIVGLLVACSSSKKAVAESKTETATEVVAVEMTPELVAGETIFNNKCGKCHALPEPSRYSKERWVPIMNSMAKKSKLSDDDRDLVYNYVTMNL